MGYINGSSDGVSYSSPVPIIGLYIFGASLVGLVFMIHDVVAGIRARKLWLPCTYFKLGPLTLTLIVSASKLPADLTTPMPSPVDQLSKLAGTVFLCISMGFLAPSLGVLAESDCFTNMVALSVIVVTVAVDIIIQLCTCLIFAFFVEHIIMLCLMFLLLMMLWHVSFLVKVDKRIVGDQYRDLLSKGESLFDRLKYCYAYAYCSNPQLKICLYSMSAAISTLCLWCCIIIIETTVRSLILKKVEFNEGVSDYSWSMVCIVYTHIATVIVGAIVILFRFASLFAWMDLDAVLGSFRADEKHVIQLKQILITCSPITCYVIKNRFQIKESRLVKLIIRVAGITWHGLWKTVLIVQFVTVYPLKLMRDALLGIKKDDNTLEYFEGVAVNGNIVQKSLDDMIRLKNQVVRYYGLSRYHPDRFPSQRVNGKVLINRGGGSIEVNSLSVAVLVKVAEASIPKGLVLSLFHAFNRAKDVIHFVDETLQPQRRSEYFIQTNNFFTVKEENDRLSYAKALWIGGDLTRVLSHHTQPQPGENYYEAAVKTIRELKANLHCGTALYDELGTVIDLIFCREHPPDVFFLWQNIEELFGDMLHAFYAQLPIAICNHLREGPVENFEDGVRLAMKFLFEIGTLKGQESWAFPEGITCIVRDEATTSSAAAAASPAIVKLFEQVRLFNEATAAASPATSNLVKLLVSYSRRAIAIATTSSAAAASP